ncbi:ferritin-like domain-containing protein [Dyadobacter sandarakinus]|uniref:Ferritin-like domain-containing protein n=1 Tax=Dyadobacter sandarakinus TaxID=2747268 RepID=A0ABX7I595_9BACT|nr:ferritin-like domain-containing protein [Dyadobacter sandarakinus]QRR01271.1 ferritin-like domain-containing protein [Dyadobacter sandarakinus]
MEKNLLTNAGPVLEKVNRRYFLRSAGVAAATGAFIMSCTLEDHEVDSQVVDLGTGDVGILNYAYALEQLEAAFYTQVIATPYSGMTAEEKTILTDIMYHEIIHRQFFKAALGGAAIKGLTPNFAGINFSDRASVLGAAKIFEDTGVSAYNGAGNLITDVNYLLVAGKIVSVEARHASAIRDLLNPNSADFAGDDIIDANGLDLASKPGVILPAVQPFVVNKISGSGLPQ